MAPLQGLGARKVLLLSLVFIVFTSALVCASTESRSLSNELMGKRRTLEDQPIQKKTSNTPSTKNQTKLVKPSTVTDSTKNQTKLVKTTVSSIKNQTTLIKVPSDSTKNKTQLSKLTKLTTKETAGAIKTQPKKLNSTSKALNSTKPTSLLTKKTSDLTKLSAPKSKATKPITTEQTQDQSDKKPGDAKSKNPDKNQIEQKKLKPQKSQKPIHTSWIDQEDEDDLVSEFKDLPSRFQETFVPDLERISSTSKVYLTKANKEIAKGFKPIVGKKYAPTVASIASLAFILIPFALVSLIFNRIKAYFSLQKLLIFIQIYLSIYFSILCLSSLVTGLEPLRFFYATSQSTYVGLQVLQTLGYVMYLLLLVMYLILVFSTDTGLGSKLLGLCQTFVGFSVGLHYYVAVFHRVVLHQPPKTSWRVHAVYATCFLVICLLARADRRKKSYLEEGGGEGKRS